jgi:hypothetical protein
MAAVFVGAPRHRAIRDHLDVASMSDENGVAIEDTFSIDRQPAEGPHRRASATTVPSSFW